MDSSLLKLLFVLLLQWSSVTSNELTTDRIVGGHNTLFSQVPYIVNLRDAISGSFFCGGSLVRRNFVVTAAHCTYGRTASSLQVQGGVTYLSDTKNIKKVLKIFLPSTYEKATTTWDVSVLKLAESFTDPAIMPISLCSKRLYVGQEVLIAGWGLTKENADQVPTQLQSANIQMISKAQCEQEYAVGGVTLTQTMICGSVPGTIDSCSGDSGGPLVADGELCGIVSFGIGCARADYPGVYTAVNVVKAFIEKCLTL